MSDKVIGWAAYEEIAVGLVNVTHCEPCGTLLNYNGLHPPPEWPCPKCKKPIGTLGPTSPSEVK
jgi:hypothetical protein